MPNFRRHSLTCIRAIIAWLLLSAAISGHVLAEEAEGITVQDLHYGDVLFHFYQEKDFDALTRLLAYRDLSRVDHHEPDAELLQGGLLLAWGQHEEAGRIFERLLANNSDQAVRDRTWFYLAKVRYQRGYIVEAERAFQAIVGELPEGLEAERYNLLARIYMDMGRFSEAVDLLSGWQGSDAWAAYARYNLGVALVRMGELEPGAALLDQVGVMSADNEELQGLRDRANVALGFAYLQAELDGEAKPVLQRVRLNGPFSNKALLGVGWADSAKQDYRQALAPWLELSQRDYLDSAVQESLLAVPFAYAKLNAETQAAKDYARALDIFAAEVTRLDQAIAEADNGLLIDALLKADSSDVDGWYWQLGKLPEDDRTRYLYFSIADHEFHEGLKSYRDLLALSAHLSTWQEKLGAFQNMLETQEIAYTEKLPQMRERVASFDHASMQSDYEEHAVRTETARAAGDAVAVASSEQRRQWEVLETLELNPAFNSSAAAAAREKQRVLKGLLLWDMERDYRVRLWRQERELNKLAEQLEIAERSFESFNAATESIPGRIAEFSARIERLTPALNSLQAQLQVSAQRHADHLTGIAVAQMQDQKQRLLTYRAQARFALASIYDRLSASNTNSADEASR